MGSKKVESGDSCKGSFSNRLKESGNIFLTLFGAVGLVGIVGASTMTVLKGPVKTMSQVTKRTIAENSMIAAGKLALNTGAADCDTDGTAEPIPFESALTGFTGGGTMPASIGVSKLDPWGTEYAYCAWDHGAEADGNCGATNPTNYRIGGGVTTEYVLAVVSAGPDGNFQTSCEDYVDVAPADGTADVPLLNKTGGSDDIVLGYTYDQAGALAGGLWSNDGGGTGATISRDISIKDKTTGVTETFGFDSDAGDLTIGNAGNIPSVNTDFLSSLNNATIDVSSPIGSDSNITTTADISAADLLASGTLGVTGTSTLGVLNAGTSTLGATGVSSLNAGSGAIVTTGTLGAGASTLGATGVSSLNAGSGAIVTTGTLGAGASTLGDTTVGTLGTSGLATLDSLAVTNNAAINGNTTLGNASGDSVTITGTIAAELKMGTNKITGLGTPADPADATTKSYVDARVAAGTGFTEVDPKVGTLTTGKWCITNAGGTGIDCTADTPTTTETDPEVGTLTNGKWCNTNGTVITCTSDAPTGGKFVDGVDTDDAVYMTGNVGVGTTTPAVELDVVGDVRASNSMILQPRSGLSAPTYIVAGQTVVTSGGGGSADDLGDHTATQNLDMDSNKIINVTDPTAAQDAATKAYVDGLASSDTLADLSCTDGQVAAWNNGGSEWVCADSSSSGSSVVFHAAQTSAQAVPNTTYTAINFNTELFDTDNTFNLTNDRFTPTTAGYYFLTAQVRFSNLGANIASRIQFLKNGSSLADNQCWTGNTGSADGACNVASIVYLNGTTDYINVRVWKNGGGSANTEPGTGDNVFFAGHLIGGGGGGADGDTLADLSCTDGQVAAWDNSGSEWVCADAASGGGGSSVAFHVTQTVAQSPPTSLTRLDFDTKVFDTDNAFDLTNDRFTPTTAGYYLITAQAKMVDNGDGRYLAIQITKNATPVARNKCSTAGAFGSEGSCNAVILVYLNGVTDFVETAIWRPTHVTDTNPEGGAGVFFAGYLISGGGGGGGAGDGDTLADLSCTDGQVAEWDNGGSAWVCATASGTDNLGDHTATQALDMDSNNIDNTGGVEFDGVAGNVPVSGGGGGNDNLGNHTATQALNMDSNNITNAGTVTAGSYLHSSDMRLKDNIVDIDDPFGLLNAVHGKHYTWKKDGKAAYGVIAQDVETVMPEAVATNPDTDMKAVEYDQLIAPLIEAVKILKEENAALQQNVKDLEQKMETLENGQ